MSLPRTLSRISGPRDAQPLGPLDPREHAWRDDLADIALAGRVAVPHYARPVEFRALRQTPVLSADRSSAVAVSELLPGERFAVLDSGHGHAWGFSVADHYVGHVALDALGPVDSSTATEGLIGPGDALLFREPGIKAEVAATLPLGSRLHWQEYDERFVRIVGGAMDGLFLHRRHLLPADGDPTLDWVEVALRFVGAPYRWGGRSRSGIDCSGLVQVSRQLAGLPCRRDTDMQFAGLTEDVPQGEARRGDLAWWPGHIGILLDRDTLLHANAHWMACRIEPLADVVARAGAGGGPAEPRVRRP
ncbi:NlpC/P60 family protein [Sandaracinobacter neustonicus]|uniref:NlpC/P60 family protein n=1 Tax=Sandaracinobacter neustonicus TaxID=1715348 RepID=A0A501XDQ1_9SPHN|nr:NlpC/P60 family protein [Sandaracinobacter neustonicus]TPE58483.1 NlpC/P60 family protein [Sandaracinobacter neustonicus]